MDGVRERYPGSHGVLELIGNPEVFAFCWRGVDAVGIELGPRGNSAQDMACLGWVSSALRTGGPWGGSGSFSVGWGIKGQVICPPSILKQILGG